MTPTKKVGSVANRNGGSKTAPRSTIAEPARTAARIGTATAASSLEISSRLVVVPLPETPHPWKDISAFSDSSTLVMALPSLLGMPSKWKTENCCSAWILFTTGDRRETKARAERRQDACSRTGSWGLPQRSAQIRRPVFERTSSPRV